jgi:fructokinase
MSARTATLVVGEALVDVVGTVRHPGGSAANTAVALARLGRPTYLATALADDADGRRITDHVTSSGVRLAVADAGVARTSTAEATIAPDGSATYEFDLEWRLGELLPEVDPGHVHVGSLGVLLDPGGKEVLELVASLRDRATVSYDVNMRPVLTGTGDAVRDRVLAMVRLSDLVKASDEDLEALWPDRDPIESAHALLAEGPVAVVVTRGAEGATWVGAEDVSVAPVPVQVVDTIGAGDTFAAGVVDAAWELGALGDGRDRLAALSTDERRTVLSWAARAAAVTVSRAGANPPTHAELLA